MDTSKDPISTTTDHCGKRCVYTMILLGRYDCRGTKPSRPRMSPQPRPNNFCTIYNTYSTRFEPLKLLGTEYQTLGVAVPPRCWPTEDQPLRGLRFAVKDAYHLRGLKTSLCNKAFLNVSSISDFTASVVQSTIRAGAQLIGTTKLSSMIGKEDPTEAIDFHTPSNPRGDGYESPATSSSGSAATVAAYDWLDFAIGTDTTGSGRRPALTNGVYRMRPTHDAVSLEGMVPVFSPWDVPAVSA